MTGSIVLETCQHACSQATLVKVDTQAIHDVAAGIPQADLQALSSPASFDAALHYVDLESPDGVARTIQYLLVVDSLNFCFWPEPGLEYEHLARGMKTSLTTDPHALDADRLAAIDGPGVQRLVDWPKPLPLQDERARLLREVGVGLSASYGGSAAALVHAAGGSALRLVELVAAAFPGFRDHAVYRGAQVFFYKRAQIFVGDVFGALRGTGLGAFHDIHELTMFADYRVPVVLKTMGILRYAPELEATIAALEEVAPGSQAEVELRASTVCAVEQLRQVLQGRLGPDGGGGATQRLLSVTLDWWLWEWGERERHQHPPHHRTLTVYY